MRPPFRWQLRSRTLELGPRTLIMGVVNVTPDSFSDGGEHFETAKAVEHALQMLDDGAGIVDIGGESTRPGAAVLSDSASLDEEAVTAEEELRRVLPVVQGVLRERPDAVISVDTYKSQVAKAVVAEGAEIVNDVSGLRWDREMAAVCGKLGCGVVVMHTRGTPKEWHTLPAETNMMAIVEHDLANRLQVAFERGIERRRIMLDPGFGFGKNVEENFSLLAHLEQLQRLGFPLLAGTSRKGFIGKTVEERLTAGSLRQAQGKLSTTLRSACNDDELKESASVPPKERLPGSIAAMVASILRGAHMVRVHDVRQAVEAAAVADAVLRAEQI